MFYFVHSFHLRLFIIVVFTFIHSSNHHSLKKNKYSEYWDSDYSCISYHHTSSPWGPSIMKFELPSYCRNSSGGLSQATLMLTPRKALANGARTSRKRKSTSRRTSACLYSLTGLGKLVCVQAINSSTTFFYEGSTDWISATNIKKNTCSFASQEYSYCTTPLFIV